MWITNLNLYNVIDELIGDWLWLIKADRIKDKSDLAEFARSMASSVLFLASCSFLQALNTLLQTTETHTHGRIMLIQSTA
jgi:hypothetical protein